MGVDSDEWREVRLYDSMEVVACRVVNVLAVGEGMCEYSPYLLIQGVVD